MTFDELMAEEKVNREVYEELLERCKRNVIVPFFGAGMSLWAGYPSWKELLLEMCGKNKQLKEGVKQLLKDHKYEEAAKKIEKAQPIFRRMLHEKFNAVAVNESKRPAYQQNLRQIFKGIWLTTNYDNLIECLLGGDLTVFYPSNDYAGFKMAGKLQRKDLVLLKLHGDIDAPDHLVLTTDNYNTAYGKENKPDLRKSMPQCLDKVFAGNAALFLGASLQRDRTMKMVTGYCANQGLTHFAVMAKPVRKELANWGIRTIWIPKKKYDEAYAALFNQLANDLDKDSGMSKRHSGKNVTKQDSEQFRAAFEFWYRKAEQGNARAQNDLGVMLAEGRGCEKDEKAAMEWYRKAADQGYAPAQLNLGWMLEKGCGCEKDEKAAVEWYRKAAEQGNVEARCDLGWMLETGHGCEQDEKEAVAWYRKAAEQGHARAQNNLGLMLAQGRGCEANGEEALRWLYASEAQGYAFVQVSLGIVHEYGMAGIKIDFNEAEKWYRKALANPNANDAAKKRATEGLERIKKARGDGGASQGQA